MIMVREGYVPVRLALTALLSGALPTLASAQAPPPPPPPSQAAAPAPGPAAPAAQDPVPAAQPAPPPKTDPLPVDLANIQELAKKQAAVRLDDEQLRFYMLVLKEAPKF